MDNKSAGVFGFHSQKAYNQCQNEVRRHQWCTKLDRYHIRLMCVDEINALMECLEEIEHTEPAYIPPLNLYRKCWMKWGKTVSGVQRIWRV